MSYCVHCGVELDATASFCPLCHTRVLDPGQPVDTASPKPFPTRRGAGGAGGQTGGGAAHYRHARLGGGVLRRTQSVPAGGPDVVAVRHRRGGHAVAVAGAAAAGPGDAPAAAAVAGRGGGGAVRLPDLRGSQWERLVSGPGRPNHPVGRGDSASVGSGAAGLPPVGPYYDGRS